MTLSKSQMQLIEDQFADRFNLLEDGYKVLTHKVDTMRKTVTRLNIIIREKQVEL